MKKELLKLVEEMSVPAISRNEEIECCNCGEDLALESYDWFSEGYEEALKDFKKLLNEKV
jgi:hypothetical protein